MEIFDKKILTEEVRDHTLIFVKYTSENFPEDNYQGEAEIISNNRLCCIASTKSHRHFTIYYDDCVEKETQVIDKNSKTVTEFWNLDPEKRNSTLHNIPTIRP
jgi:hypothetical protein